MRLFGLAALAITAFAATMALDFARRWTSTKALQHSRNSIASDLAAEIASDLSAKLAGGEACEAC